MERLKFDMKKVECPACGSDQHGFEGWRGGDEHHSGSGIKTAIVRCKNCTHQYPNPMPIPSGDLNDLYENAEQYFFGHDIDEKIQNGIRLVSQFEERLGYKGRFLDVGCGLGELLRAALDEGWEAEGIDPSIEFVTFGQEKLGVNARVGTLGDARFPSDHFDAIAMSSLIEHLYEPFPVLLEIQRILKPNGLLWFDAPNEDGLYMKFGNLYMKLRGREQLVVMAPTFAPFHVQGFNPRSIVSILDRANLQTLDLSVIGEVCAQSGESSIQKRIEFFVAQSINRLGRMIGKGTYMSIWAKRKSS